jgi:hypothetical protein
VPCHGHSPICRSGLESGVLFILRLLCSSRKDRQENGQMEIEKIMPTIKGFPGPYRFFFYSFDCNEPKHVHIQREKMVCKFWLEPVTLSTNHGFSPRELNGIREMIIQNRIRLMEAWDEHCG